MAGVVVTFYSYKGGVGRSFALANVAALLARWGLRILCVDWDIEAPGLTDYFAPYLQEAKPGLVDMLLGFAAAPDQRLAWNDFLTEVLFQDGTGLKLLSAGSGGSDHAASVRTIDWEKLYVSGLGIELETMFSELRERFDIVLIDSRTGITEFGGIVTAQLPDILVCVFTANNQSLNGANWIATRSQELRNSLPLARDRLLVLPVPARFDDRFETELAAEWRARIAERLRNFFRPWADEHAAAAALLDLVTIPYVPYWSFGERLAVVEGPQSLEGGIDDILGTIAALLCKRLGGTTTLVQSRASYISSARRICERTHQETYDVFLAGDRPANDLSALRAALLQAGLTVYPEERQMGQDWGGQITTALSVCPETA